MNEIFPIILRLPTKNIVEVKLIIEGYDEVGIIRTLSQKGEESVIAILTLKDTYQIGREIINQISSRYEITELTEEEAKDLPKGDWLVEEFKI